LYAHMLLIPVSNRAGVGTLPSTWRKKASRRDSTVTIDDKDFMSKGSVSQPHHRCQRDQRWLRCVPLPAIERATLDMEPSIVKLAAAILLRISMVSLGWPFVPHGKHWSMHCPGPSGTRQYFATQSIKDGIATDYSSFLGY
jgi:hypothetical protein